MNLGKKIKKYLIENNLKQKIICDALNLSDVVVSGMLSGNRKISAEEYFAICDCLGLPYEYFTDKAS